MNSGRDILKWFISKLTILTWYPDYNLSTLRKDLSAGLTVGVMLIPQGMAYAVLGGLPAIYGLYASLVPLIIYPLFGTSRHLSVGIVAIDMLIVAAGVGAIAEFGTDQYLAMVIILAMLVGLTQIAMAIARLGFIVNLLSKPVVIGFTAAAPIIIAFSQLSDLMGVDLTQSQHIYVIFNDLIENWGNIHTFTFVFGLAGIFLLLAVRKFFPIAPEALILVVFSSLLVWAGGFQQEGIEIVGAVPEGLPRISVPGITFDNLRRLIPTVITLALVQFMNIVTLGRTFASRHKYTISPNRELFAIGSSNFFGSFFQSSPISGSFSRSAINEQSHAETPMSNLFAAMLIGLTLLFFTPLFYYVPMPALSAIIIVAALSLINIKEVKYLFRTKERDGYIALFTFVTTLVIGIQEGILLGVAASLIAVLARTSRPNVAELGHIKGSQFFRDLSRYQEARQIKGILILRVDASFSFNNAEYFKDFIIHKSEEEDREVKAVIIEGRSINDMDTTAIEALQIVCESLNEIGIELHFAGLKGAIRDVMLRSGLARQLGGTHFHMNTHYAVKYILEKWAEEGKEEEDQRLDEYLKTAD